MSEIIAERGRHICEVRAARDDAGTGRALLKRVDNSFQVRLDADDRVRSGYVAFVDGGFELVGDRTLWRLDELLSMGLSP